MYIIIVDHMQHVDHNILYDHDHTFMHYYVFISCTIVDYYHKQQQLRKRKTLQFSRTFYESRKFSYRSFKQ